jgi:Uma2 family endonuclease
MTNAPRIDERYTIDAFEAFLAMPENVDRLFELIDGVIVEKMPTELHNLIVGILFNALWNWVVPRKLGRVTTETRVRARRDDMDNDRLPDIGFTTKARLLPVVSEGAVLQIPDLCIEVQSPRDYPKEMRAKAEYYIANGAQQVWLVYTKKKFIEVLYADGSYDHFLMGEIVSTGDLIPGFSIAVADVFDIEGL